MIILYALFLLITSNSLAMNTTAISNLDENNPEEVKRLERTCEEAHIFLCSDHIKNPYQLGSGVKTFKNLMSNTRTNIRKIYRVDNTLAGFFISFLVRTTKNKYNKNFSPLDTVLVMMAVHPENRKKGHGYAIMQEVISWAEENKSPAIWLAVTENNYDAQRLYKKCGFYWTGLYQNKNEKIGSKSFWLIKHLSDTPLYQAFLNRSYNPDVFIRHNH